MSMSNTGDYENNRELIDQTVRLHGIVKAYDMLRDKIGGSRRQFILYCQDNGIKSRPRGPYETGRQPTVRRRKPGGSLAADNAAARAEGLTYGQRQAQEWCKAHPLTRKVVPFNHSKLRRS